MAVTNRVWRLGGGVWDGVEVHQIIEGEGRGVYIEGRVPALRCASSSPHDHQLQLHKKSTSVLFTTYYLIHIHATTQRNHTTTTQPLPPPHPQCLPHQQLTFISLISSAAKYSASPSSHAKKTSSSRASRPRLPLDRLRSTLPPLR